MNILMFHNHRHSIDPIIYHYLKKHVKVFLLSKGEGDLVINNDDTIDKALLNAFIKKNRITHFFYSENSSYIPIFLHLFPKHIIKVMLLIDTHINVKKRLPYLSLFDLVLLVNKQQQKELLKYNPNIEWFTYGGDTDVFFKLPQLKKVHDVTFNGNIIPWVHYHRFILLTYLKIVGIKVFYSKDRYPKHNKLFNTSKIILNRTPMGGWNLRVFEVLSSGSLLLSDRPSNGMEKIFMDKTHLVYYDSLSDLKTKIQYYLTHNEEREKIASQGYKFVRENYSWDIQIKKMLVIFNNFHFKKFKHAPYYFSLFELECFSFRNKALAVLCLKKSYMKKEIKKSQYMYYWILCSFYLSTTAVLINLLNILRTRIILNSLSK